MTSVDSNFIIFCGRPHGAGPPSPPSTCVHLSLTPSPIRVDVIKKDQLISEVLHLLVKSRNIHRTTPHRPRPTYTSDRKQSIHSQENSEKTKTRQKQLERKTARHPVADPGGANPAMAPSSEMSMEF